MELELWGGHEYALNRIGDQGFDQTRLSGHQERVDDLDLFAALGLKALRYPVLWERVSPHRPDVADWTWSDARLARLRKLNLRPIVGLVHHGAGPRYTSLLDEGFAEGLAGHALSVASRYPWVRDWTPVNEPLTTARFSAQYGLWHPHEVNERAFWLALLNQVAATRAAMRAVRTVNADARLIQTEDIGRTYATAPLVDQADFDNERRWMTWDLLCGRVNPHHRFWARLAGLGLEGRLRSLLDEPCPPDVLGLNHYLTSDRFLDHRTSLYPKHLHGGNDSLSYADVEAVRVAQPGPALIAGALDETWRRYETTLAITECHNGCTREEQMRWLWEAWSAALSLQSTGGQIEAVTTWALLGSHNWSSLLTRQDAGYECGAFDVRKFPPRRTAIATMIEALATGTPVNEVATAPGWWRRDIRLQHKPVFRSVESPEPSREWRPARNTQPTLLVTGATGTLGKAVARACEWRGLAYVLTDRGELDLAVPSSVRGALDRVAPWAVINAAGYVRVDDAEADEELCLRANCDGALTLARICGEHGIPTVSFSSDLVFDGQAGRPMIESDAPRPLNVYGKSKAQMEKGLRTVDGKHLIVRTAAFFSPFDPNNFAMQVVRDISRGKKVFAATDLVVSPTFVPDLVDAVLDLLLDGETGVWHLANAGSLSWADFARRIATAARLDAAFIVPTPWLALGMTAPRAPAVSLASERGELMPPLHDALRRFAALLAPCN